MPSYTYFGSIFYKAYSKILNLQEQNIEAKRIDELAKKEQQFLDEFWWDAEKQAYNELCHPETFLWLQQGDRYSGFQSA
mgnify:CR=1 FL=1